MTEQCKHEWEYRYMAARPRCRICLKYMHISGVEARLNATERLSAEDAKTAAKDLNVAKQMNNLLADFETMAALQAYADALAR